MKAGGPEPENNPRLRAIIATCKRENMPKDNITRAIKNAMGKDQSDYKEVTYEGYGPHGVAILVDTLTDNTTRTVADVRSVFNKFSGNLGTTGSLSFLFDHKAVFTFKPKADTEMDELILDLIDYGVEDEYDTRSPLPSSLISPMTSRIFPQTSVRRSTRWLRSLRTSMTFRTFTPTSSPLKSKARS